MSQVLKRLTSLTEGGYAKCNYFLSASPLSSRDCSLCTIQRNHSTSSGVGVFHAGRTSWMINGFAFGSVGTKQLESCRSMSILTDLLRGKKKEDDDEVDEPIPEAKTLTLYEEPPRMLTEEEILAKRDVSRLNPDHKRLVHGQHPHLEPVAWFHHTVRYKQRMFGKYGESSGVNPGILWDTREDLALRREYEQVANPLTVQEMVEKRKQIRQQEKEAKDRRTREVEEKMAMIDKYKEDLDRRLAEKDKEANEAKARRERLMEEVRRHFGFTVDSRDERFQEMLAKKEKEEKKKLKEARKLEKQKKILEKLEKHAAKEKSGKKADEQVEPNKKKQGDDDED